MADKDEIVKQPSRKGQKQQPGEVHAVVGIGVCSASLGSLEDLFRGLSEDLSAAYIIAVRQKEGLDVGTVVDLLSGMGKFPVKLAADGEPLQPNSIYIGGPDDMITLDDGHVRTRPTTEVIGHRGTVDSMLISLAENAQDRAVAVILRGLGNDGTAGVAATKKFGGLSIAEATGQEDHAADQGASGPFGIVDLVVSVEEAARQIGLYVRNIVEVGREAGPEDVPEQVAAQINQIATILRNVTSNDFHGYKRNTFLRRVHRRMQVLQIEDIDAYVARLRSDRDEVQHLFQDLLIGVTSFFRDPQEFEVLEAEIPRLFHDKAADDQVRVWVLGCATGEEAYSIAILLREHMATLDTPPQVQIFATDLDARALTVARAGRYPDSIAEQVRPDRLTRWFIKEGDTYCVSKELREICIFSPHNVVKDAPFSRIDLLSCRNLLIYLNSELQNRVIPIFHFALRPGGVLFLGSSENVTRHQKLFSPVDRKNRVFRRLDTATRVLPDFPLSPRVPRSTDALDPPVPTLPRAGALTGAISRRAEAIAERYAPAYVVVDDQGDVLHFSGRTGRYLEPSAGAATLNLLSLVHRDLRLDLRSALHRAAAEQQPIEVPNLPIQRDGQTFGVNLVVEPVATGDVTTFVIVFQDAGRTADLTGSDGERLVSDEHVQRLDAELRLTKERLQATIEELESTNEELKSSNEEYQSINEELQSANEELETSKEELQSVNEELQTVNGELAHRVSELARTNSDLKNLLESTQIATIFLDNDLRVRSFTPAATNIFHVLETDVGRPIDHVASRIAYAELKDDARQVLKTLESTQREVRAADTERHYIARILPYRSIDNFIAGAVLTFLDVTQTMRAEAALRQSEASLQIALEVGQLATWDWNMESGEVVWNDEHYRMQGYAVGEVKPSFEAWALRVHRDDFENTKAELERAKEQRREYIDEFRVVHPDGTVRWCSSRGRFFYDAGGRAVRMIGVMEDTTERRHSLEMQQTLIAELQHRTRNLLSIVRSISQQTARSSSSLEEFSTEFGERLAAMSRVQGLLSRGDGFSVTLGELIRAELSAHGAPVDGTQIEINGPRVVLSSREVQVLTLALHELTTNAVKYGALSQPEAKLQISWSLQNGDSARTVAIEWAESGVVLPAGSDADKRGFGRELIERALPYDLGAKTKFEIGPDGVRCELKVPLRQGGEETGPHGEAADNEPAHPPR